MNGDPIHRAEKVCIFWNFCIYSFLDFFQHGIHSPENSVLLSSWPKITSCWSKYLLIFDTINQIWNLLNMDYLSLRQVSVDDWNSSPVGLSNKKKNYCQDIWNVMLMGKLTCVRDLIYSNFILFCWDTFYLLHF